MPAQRQITQTVKTIQVDRIGRNKREEFCDNVTLHCRWLGLSLYHFFFWNSKNKSKCQESRVDKKRTVEKVWEAKVSVTVCRLLYKVLFTSEQTTWQWLAQLQSWHVRQLQLITKWRGEKKHCPCTRPSKPKQQLNSVAKKWKICWT